MGNAGAGERPQPNRGGAGVVVLRAVAAAVALAALAAVTADLAGKGNSAEAPSPASETPAPTPDEGTDRRRRERGWLARESEPTVYDAQGDLERCTRPDGAIGAASRGPGLTDDIRRISARVERIRQLRFRRPVDARLVSRAEVGDRFSTGYLRRYDEGDAARDEHVLRALRLLPEGVDLRAVTARMFAGGVAGFYNPRTDRLFAASTGGALTAYDEMVLAHELGHALIDQTLGLPRTLSRAPMLRDAMIGHQALAEGDATLVMTRYAAARLTSGELESFLTRFSQRTVRPRADVPYFLARTSEFPYYEGLLFACRTWRPRRWGAIDRMYLRPPATTADVLFPGRYRAREPVELPLSPPSPGRRWGRGRAQSFGALDLMVLLENADLLSEGATVPGSHVDAVRGWDGGALRSWLRGDDTIVHLALVDAGTETAQGRRRRLCDVLRGWFETTFPDAEPARAGVAGAEAWRAEGDLAVLRCKRAAVELAKGSSARGVRRLFGR